MDRKKVILLVATLALLIIINTSHSVPSNTTAPNITFAHSTLSFVTQQGTIPIDVEVASTNEQQELGLMYRTQLEDKHGMIFDFGRPKHVTMWMKNTLIPLDMVFLNNEGVVTRIEENATPQSERIIDSEGPAQFVVELNGGAANKYHIAKGDKIIYSGVQ